MQPTEHAWTPGLGSLGLALVVPITVLIPALPEGGIAATAVAAVVALFVGAPAALAEWRTNSDWPRGASPVGVAITEGLGDLVALGVIAAAAAPWARMADAWGIVAIGAGWGIAWGLSPRASTAGFPALLAILVALFAGLDTLVAGSNPTTLLHPQWGAWRSWLGPSLVAGLWMGGIGSAEWTLGPRRRPGQRRAPFAGVGAALIVLVGLTAFLGGRFETELGLPGPDPQVGAVMVLGLIAAGAAVIRRRSASGWGGRRGRVLFGILLTGWAAGPALGSVPLAWSGALPAAMLVLIGLGLPRLSGAGQITAGIAGGVALAALGLGWGGVPAGIGDAATAAATLAMGFWLVATRAVVAWRTV